MTICKTKTRTLRTSISIYNAMAGQNRADLTAATPLRMVHEEHQFIHN